MFVYSVIILIQYTHIIFIKKLNSYNKLVKDVELYDPKTKKSKMIYKPAKEPNEQRD